MCSEDTSRVFPSTSSLTKEGYGTMENVRRWVRGAWAQNMVLLSTHELSTGIYLLPRLSLPGLLAKIRWRIRFLTKKHNYLSS